MSPEKMVSFEDTNERMAGGGAETVAGVESRLAELGWSKDQIGNFPAAIQTMADAMARGGNVGIELNTIPGENGEEVAEVTLAGEGEGLDPSQLQELIEKGELFIKVFTEADPEFFAGQNKVILRRKKDRAPETDSI